MCCDSPTFDGPRMAGDGGDGPTLEHIQGGGAERKCECHICTASQNGSEVKFGSGIIYGLLLLFAPANLLCFFSPFKVEGPSTCVAGCFCNTPDESLAHSNHSPVHQFSNQHSGSKFLLIIFY